METEVSERLQRRVLPADGVEAGDEGGDGAAVPLGGVPVAGGELVLLGVQVLLGALPQGGVLAEFVAAVEAPGGGEGGGQDGADLEGGASAVLEVGVQDVGGVGEQVGPHVAGGVPRQFGEVVGQFLFGGAPGEVGVGLLEADLGQGVHHRGAGEGLGQEDDVGVGAVDVGDDAFPERDGFGVGVVDPEDAHAGVHPVAQDAAGLGVQALGVGVEGDRVDVLVLLGRVLGVGDGVVGAVVEPLGVFVDPGVVGGALQGEVQGDLESAAGGLADEPGEVLQGAQAGVDGVVAALGGADGPGHADVVGGGGEGCCCVPCGGWCRWGGWGAGRRRRSPSRRWRAAGGRRCAGCRAARWGCPRSGGRTRTRSRTGRVRVPRAGASGHRR
ncbi:hypothetical protein SHIRM173S_05678 [Streptomyces hirsutus]